jgi:hypothetical protein
MQDLIESKFFVIKAIKSIVDWDISQQYLVGMAAK